MTNIVSSVGERIPALLKQYRERAGLTIYQVGELIGKSGKTVSAWEHGRGQPDADMFLKLCDVYKVESISVFFGQPPVQIQGLDDLENENIQLFRKLNKAGQEKVLEYIHDLVATGRYKKGVGETPVVGEMA